MNSDAKTPLFAAFERHQRAWEVTFWVFIGVINAVINATSVLMEYARRGDSIGSWEPFVWEFSSTVVGLILIGFILLVDRHYPLHYGVIRRHLSYHLLATLVYALLHVSGMVALRQLAYWWAGSEYDFGHWGREFFYEYRKDLLTYGSIMLVLYSYRFILSRLKGEARVIQEGEETEQSEKPTRLLIKKLGKEFIIRVEDIDWIEAAGNYMNLHVGNKMYPLRETMTGMEAKLNAEQFVRIHRSHIVNLDRIVEIVPLESGDHSVILSTGQALNFSRRYRAKVKDRLSI
ncbi:LytTR family DNA-binding domain-containing protein [Pleionea sp. CnH1-48]|uniref:LytR/AlgR family response regulator transcription factor n=1 Tax=Pleionea sp. CnH1-48 TaxID=2954494 RepID=UPI0020982751|nr:LytTR family DNA-binding domain-containing protein [Pleionea sp. CnH1-48]MCO7222793.1 LytTR family transcriptional regulator [Pleionea sp. CnH1-48]